MSQQQISATQLIDGLKDAHLRTLALVRNLNPAQLMGPPMAITNPFLWEIGHVAWFHERWVLRGAGGRPSLLPDADRLYDSSAIPHDTRWDLPLPSLDVTRNYLRQVLATIVQRLETGTLDNTLAYFCQLTLFHEDMHDEAFTYMRQTLAYALPDWPRSEDDSATTAGPLAGDVEVPGGTFALGSLPENGFVFDNEKWSHSVTLAPFRIARAPVTNAEFTQFVEDGGYQRRALWDDDGWAWRTTTGLEAPVYWRHDGQRWQARHFDRWLPLRPHAPVIHVTWHEAQAYCRWAQRRLPTEAEWEMAAACEPAPGGNGISAHKRRFPWGNEPFTAARANLDGYLLGCADVGAYAAGDSAFGCRQMFGNVWEWTATTFLPYPGFVADPYKDYSEPWFGTRKVLRGGAWATRSRMLRNTWRNFFPPDRNDVFAGFRTCALS